MRKFLFTFLVLFASLTGFGQLLSEGFDDITTLEPNGWTITNQSNPIGIISWFQGNDTVFPSHSGAATSYIGANFNSTAGSGTISNWLITPTLNVKDGDKLSFWTRTATGSIWNDRLEVRMSQGTMTLPTGASGVGSFTTVMTIINDGYNLSYPEVWTKFELTVSGIGSSPAAANFAFRYNVVNGGPSGTDSNYIGIDDVLVEEGESGGSGDLTCFTLNHDLVATFNGTFFIWETGEVSDDSSISGWNFNPWANGGNLSFFFSTGSNAVSATAGGLDWLVLGPGDVIGPSSTYGATIGFPSNWSGGADGYLGIKFPCSAPGGECYGYVHMTTTGSTGYPATVVDYCVDLDGNEVTIPEEGGGGACLWTVHVWDDYWGDEVEWELRNSGGTVLISGGPYGSTYDDTQSVSDEGPVTFWITNEGVINDNTPNYEVSNDNGVVISGQLTSPTTETFADLKCSDGGGGTGDECEYELFTTSAGDPANFFNSFAGVTFDMQNSGTENLTITGFKVPVTGGSSLDIDVYYTTTAGSNVGVQSDPSAWTLLESLTGVPAIEAAAWDVNTFTQVSLTNTLTLTPGESKGFYVIVTNYSTGMTYHYTNGNFTATDGYLTILSNGFGSSDVPFVNSFADRAFVGEVQYNGECNEPPGDDCEFGIPSFSDLANAYNIEMSNSFRTADDFILTEDFAMDKITIDTNQQEIPNDVIIYIHEDNAGKPGTVLHTLTFAGPDESEIVGSAFGDPIYHMTFNVSPALDFVPGTYWIDPKMSTSSGETVWWGATDQASYGAVPQRSTDDGASWSEDPNGLSMIFTVSGICGDGPPPAGDCEQDFYTTEDPISGAGFSSGNWVANDVIVPGNTQFTMQTMTFETVALSGQPTNFDLEIFEDNGSGGVGNSTGMTYHFDSSNMTFTPNGLLFGVYPQFTVVFNLPDILLQANGSADTRYWLAVTSDLSSTSDFTYWVSYLHSFTPIPDSNPTWQYLASDGVWAQYDSSGPNEGYMKVEGHCETLGTGDLNAFDFAYYPNPVRDVLNITSQKAVKSVEAFNMTGQKVLTANKVVNGQIDVNALSPGVYVFKAVLEGGRVETFKIIKK